MRSLPQRAQRSPEGGGINRVTEGINGAAMRVHSALGPGLLEKAYAACLAFELSKAGFDVLGEVELPVVDESIRIELGYRADRIVNDLVIVDVKCVEKIIPVHEARIISYRRLSEKKIGLLINFHVRSLCDGIKRFGEGPNWN
jgi:GxxExxY protein